MVSRKGRGSQGLHRAMDDLASGNLIERQTGQSSIGHVADSALVGLELPAYRRATQRDEPAIQRWKVRWPAIESPSAAPNYSVCGRKANGRRIRTWAPRGQTPVLQYTFNWKCLSAIAITIGTSTFSSLRAALRLLNSSPSGPSAAAHSRQADDYLGQSASASAAAGARLRCSTG